MADGPIIINVPCRPAFWKTEPFWWGVAAAAIVAFAAKYLGVF
jgi:anti-sigma-K factor RskA